MSAATAPSAHELRTALTALDEEVALRRAAEARVDALAAEVAALRADVSTLLAERAALQPQPTALTSLPAALACAVLLRLPVCDRARCAAVCRAWRRLLSRERALWATLDFSHVMQPPDSMSVEHLLGATRRAGPALRVLDLRGQEIERKTLRRVLRCAPALDELALGSLWCKAPRRPHSDGDDEELHTRDTWDLCFADVSEVLRMLPRGAALRRLRCESLRCSHCNAEKAAKLLRPGGLALCAAWVQPQAAEASGGGGELCVDMLYADVVEREEWGRSFCALLAAAAAPHVGLRALFVGGRVTDATMAALVDAAAAAPHLRELSSYCSLRGSPACAQQLDRLRQLRPDLQITITGLA